MPDLYVANCTSQKQIVMYRLDFDEAGKRTGKPTPARRSPPIPPGQQIKLLRDMPMDANDLVVSQLAKYGLRGEGEIGRLPRQTVPLIFNVGQPVRARSIEIVHQHNKGVLNQDGKARREAAAIAAAANVESPQVETSIEEIEEADVDRDPEAKRIEEGYRMVQSIDEVPPAARQRVKRKGGTRAQG